MKEIHNVKKRLWIITGVASIPFALLTFFKPELVQMPEIFLVFFTAFVFNGIVVPFVFFSREPNWFVRVVSIGANLLFATLLIHYTGGLKSVFYPAFYFLPIIASTMICGLSDSIITAFLATILAFSFKYEATGWKNLISGEDVNIFVIIIFFFLMASIIGYLIRLEKRQQVINEKIAAELQAAYDQLSASHDQLQNYTEIIEKMNKEMEQLAITDELTMLYNYRYFQVSLDKEIKKNKDVTLMMLDIDYFKQFNDAYGHLTGNKILMEVAEIIKENVRTIDIVVRYGGEEFAVILPATETEEAVRVAQRIRSVIENAKFNLNGREAQITVSIGIASYPGDASDKRELISRADMALYQAKQSGRNSVCIFRHD